MDIPEYPPNSEVSKKGAPDGGKDISPVVSGSAVRRKKSFRRQFKETFVSGDARTAIQYVLFDVLLPAAKDMVVEAGAQGIEKLIFGDSRRRGGSTPPQAGPYGHIAYNRYSAGAVNRFSGPQRALSRRARSRHDFDELMLESRAEAEEVIDRMYDLISRYEVVSVGDLYELTGLAATHTDNKWGWTDLSGAGVSRTRDGGYLLDLPEPRPLD